MQQANQDLKEAKLKEERRKDKARRLADVALEDSKNPFDGDVNKCVICLDIIFLKQGSGSADLYVGVCSMRNA